VTKGTACGSLLEPPFETAANPRLAAIKPASQQAKSLSDPAAAGKH
jgi:hypothetical protein